MADVPFIQRSRIGRSVFLLRHDRLEVKSRLYGATTSREFPLRNISADYQIIARRFWILILWPLGVAAVASAILYAVVSLQGLSGGLTIYPLIFLSGAAWGAIQGVPRIELFVFFDHWHRPLFYVVRELEQAKDCEAFIQALLERLEYPEGDAAAPAASNGDARETSVALPRDGSPGIFGLNGRWKTSIAAGALSAGLPHVLQWFPEFAGWVFPLVMLFTISGLVTGVLSLLMRERLCLLALVGIGLSMIAPLFYSTAPF